MFPIDTTDEDSTSKKRRAFLLSVQWWCFGFAYRVAYFAYFSFTFGMASQFTLYTTAGVTTFTPLFALSTAVGAFAVVFGSALLPVFSFVWLRRHKARHELFAQRTPFTEFEKIEFEKVGRLQRGRFMAPFFLPYKPARDFFGLLVFTKKCLLGVLLASLQAAPAHALGALAVSIGIIGCYLLSLAALRPYRLLRSYVFDGVMHLMQLVTLALLIALLGHSQELVLVEALEAAHYAAMVFFLAQCVPFIIWDVWTWRHKAKVAKKEQYELGSRLAMRNKLSRGS